MASPVVFKNPNVFQPDWGLDRTGPLGAIAIRCPHCQQLGSFHSFGLQSLKYIKESIPKSPTGIEASIRGCPNQSCNGLVFVIESGGKALRVEPPETIDFSPKGLPIECLETLKEAIACHAAGAYRASAMMVRRLLEEICHLNGAKGANLHQRLSSLKDRIVLPEALFHAMGELKALGNDAAHIEAIEYANIGREEAEDSIELAKEILKALYQLQGLVSRLQARKNTN